MKRPQGAIDPSGPWSSIQRWYAVDAATLPVQIDEAMSARRRSELGDARLAASSVAGLPSPTALAGTAFVLTARLVELLRAETAARTFVVATAGPAALGGLPVPFVIVIQPGGVVELLDSCEWVTSDFKRVAAALVAEGTVANEAELARGLAAPDGALWAAFKRAQQGPAADTPLPWAEKAPAERSTMDPDIPLDVAKDFLNRVVDVTIPAKWAESGRGLGLCTRTSIAWNSCVSLAPQPFEPPAMALRRMMQVVTLRDQPVQVFLGDLNKPQEKSFVTHLGWYTYAELEASTTLRASISPRFADVEPSKLANQGNEAILVKEGR